MLRRLFQRARPRSGYDVMAAIACFGVLAGGTAYAANTVRSTDIVDGEVQSVDIANDSIQSGDVKDNSINTFDVHSFLGVDVVDGTLEDQDIAQATFVNFSATIGAVAANSCAERSVTGVNAEGDHLLLTPIYNNADGRLTYTPESTFGFGGTMRIRVCNPTNSNVDDGTTQFNLLVIDAQ